jgi:archaeosortase B (VPXXXP-CTERM-specific)
MSTASRQPTRVARAWSSLREKTAGILRNPQARYPLLVLLYLGVIGGLFNASLGALRPTLERLEAFTAASVHVLMGAFTGLTTQRGNLVTFDGFAVSIIIECVGLLEMLIYSACVLAFPAPMRARLIGVGAGCAAIFFFNLLRIVTLLVVGRHWGDYFDFFHVYFWQATLIAMIVSVLYGWITLFVQRETPARA